MSAAPVRPRDAAGMKRLALGLLLAAALLYALATALVPRHAGWGYLAAFAEAAMVGAIADWFAVVALFRHPLGLPIPHTAIIPSGKGRIGDNLAGFLATHFLATEQVLDKLREFDAAGRLAGWLARPANAERVGRQLAGVGRWAVQALDDEHVRGFVADLARRGLGQVEVARLSGQLLEAMTHERRHQELLDGVLAQLARLLGQDSVQDAITETIAREIRALKYVGLDQVAARLATRKVVVVVARTIIDMADDPRAQSAPALRRHGRGLRDAAEGRAGAARARRAPEARAAGQPGAGRLGRPVVERAAGLAAGRHGARGFRRSAGTSPRPRARWASGWRATPPCAPGSTTSCRPARRA
jgi:uncharacterized membrane-anchored protein YjiN (DUF445 family)